MDILIGGITFNTSQIAFLNHRGIEKDQVRTRSLDGSTIETVTTGITHKYTLKLHSISNAKYREFYQKLIDLDINANGKITIETKGEIRQGIAHLDFEHIPDTIEFDFDIDKISPTPNVYYDLTLPLEIYVAV